MSSTHLGYGHIERQPVIVAFAGAKLLTIYVWNEIVKVRLRGG
jgi:hypothetical protein